MTQGCTSGVIQHLALLLFGVSHQVSISHWSLKASGDVNQKHSITPEHLIALTDTSHSLTVNV
jgi:predicted transcriptional regulator